MITIILLLGYKINLPTTIRGQVKLIGLVIFHNIMNVSSFQLDIIFGVSNTVRENEGEQMSQVITLFHYSV